MQDGTGKTRPECTFKEKCYRKNPHHFKEYKHLHLAALWKDHPDFEVVSDTGIGLQNLREQLKVFADIENLYKKIENENKTSVVKNSESRENIETTKRSRSSSPEPRNKRLKEDTFPEMSESAGSSAPRSKIQNKLDHAAPFNLFLTKIKENPTTQKDNHSVYMTDLLHPSLGKLKSSLQINFMVELDWLMMNYEETKNDKKPLVILYGEENSSLASSSLQDNIRAVRVKPKYPFGTHHTKMMVLVYEDESVRVVVHTANLIGSDWENRTQGVWVSPRCPKLEEEGKNKGDSPTNFKASLIRYLKFYEVSSVQQFIQVISSCDMSAVNVFFVASVPNSHRDSDVYKWGHRAVSRLLRQYVPQEVRRWPVKVQCSSIGSLGRSPDQWMEHELGRSLSCHAGTSGALPSSGNVELIYPSHQDVLDSYEGPLGGGCLPYSANTHNKQPWLLDHMHNWKAEASDRTRAMPHIKSYTRVDPDNNKMAYFLLTSANLSKAAWGSMNKAGDSCLIMSYEAGVLFIPSFVTGEEYFSIAEFNKRTGKSSLFPLHYDLPLTKYRDGEKPWFMDFLRS